VIESYLAGRVINCVNLVVEPDGDETMEIRHLDRVGVLASIFDVLRRNGLNVRQMENRPFVGGLAAVATINVDGVAEDAVLAELRAIDEVLAVSVAIR
jgi:D-3-phosphoglycerate dehydrogenase